MGAAMRPSQSHYPRRGFILIDTVVGMALVAGMIVLLGVQLQQHRHVTERLAQRRAALNLAERVLTDLQAGQPAPTPERGMTVKVAKVPGAMAATDAGQWVEVRVTGPAGAQSLIGLVAAAPQEGRP